MHNKTTTALDSYEQMCKSKVRVKRTRIIRTEVKQFVTPTVS